MRLEGEMRAVDALEEALPACMITARTFERVGASPAASLSKWQYPQGLDAKTKLDAEQDLAVLYLKVAIGKNGQKHPDIFKIVKQWGALMPPSGCENSILTIWTLQYLEDIGQTTERIWDEYQSNPDSTLAKARKAYLNLVQDTI